MQSKIHKNEYQQQKNIQKYYKKVKKLQLYYFFDMN